MAISGEQSLTFKTVADRQTNKKAQSFWPRRRSPNPTKFGTVIEDLEHVLADLKQSGLCRIVLPLEGAENFGETQTPSNLNPHNSVTP